MRNILSLFDGISCGQIALNRAGIKYDNYFASEIEEKSIKVTQTNYPKTVQLGDVCGINVNSLPKIDLLMAGSPCQGFSFAGKGLNFNDPRSKLFFEFVRILNELREINPNIKFLLENVRMKKDYQDIISKYVGVEPIMINSSLVSAQNRVRFYWTNIENIIIPQDKNIKLADVIQQDYDGIWVWPRGANKGGVQDYKGKSPSITTSSWEHNFLIYRGCALRTRKFPQSYHLEVRKDEKANCLLTVGDKSMAIRPQGDYRKFTPIEAERLQTVPENYTSILSNSQRFKCLGNGWTIDVITHILKNISWNSNTTFWPILSGFCSTEPLFLKISK